VTETDGGASGIVEIVDERDPVAESALDLIASAFERPDRQPLYELRSEIAEKRLGLLAAMDFHLLASVAPDGKVVGTVAGMYLAGVNSGFVTYLTVDPAHRGRHLARTLRAELVEVFRRDSRRDGMEDLDWVVGEVEADSAWLRRLVRSEKAVAFDLDYFHPGMSPESDGVPYILYREPVADSRPILPAATVRRILYAIYRRGYRVRYPLEHPGFQAMLLELEGREEVGRHPDFAG
jgi:ribosomal protein S18 acetylase RimI-like enzyme